MDIRILAYVTAFATLIYGFATILLWNESRQDRKQRQRQFEEESANSKLNELYRAFYEAWGFWNGHALKSGDSIVDASQSGRISEALIRLECQLRLNNYQKEANNLGFSIRTFRDIDERLGEVGTALGLTPSSYRYPDKPESPLTTTTRTT
jgi:hypothetical protein